jgi:hypothetical protein
MATQLDLLMGKTPSSGMPTTRATSQTERRGTRRCKITQLMHLRPSDPEKDPFEDLRGTLSVSRTGVFFQTSEPAYEVGMRLFVTMPYSQDPVSMSREYLAEVVRKEDLPNGLSGVGFKILMEMGLHGGFSSGYPRQRK